MLLCPDGFEDTKVENCPSSYPRNIRQGEDKAKRNAFKRAMNVINY